MHTVSVLLDERRMRETAVTFPGQLNKVNFLKLFHLARANASTVHCKDAAAAAASAAAAVAKWLLSLSSSAIHIFPLFTAQQQLFGWKRRTFALLKQGQGQGHTIQLEKPIG